MKNRLASLLPTLLFCGFALAIPLAWVAGQQASAKPRSSPLTIATPTAAESFLSCYSRGHAGHFTAWVQFTITPQDLHGSPPDRPRHFTEDPSQPPEFRWSELDYVSQQWDVGHCCEAAIPRTDAAEKDTFIITNTMPQNPALNRGQWARLEKYIRDRVQAGETATVVTGPAFLPDSVSGKIAIETFGKHKLWVPTHCWKAVIFTGDSNDGKAEMLAWLIPNERLDGDYDEFRVSVDDLEAAVGLDLFAGVPAGEAMEKAGVKGKQG